MAALMPVNSVLRDEITKLTDVFVPSGSLSSSGGGLRSAPDSLSFYIDQIGAQSARAQGLVRPITSAELIRNSHNVIYIIKDQSANGGHGDLAGFLKVGPKYLYLIDEHNQYHDKEVLCVLDFFVKRSYQRRGLGRKLFDFCLNDNNKRVYELAVDEPSVPMESFLRKHYGITKLIRQNNHFAVAPEFFTYNALASRDVAESAIEEGSSERVDGTEEASSLQVDETSSDLPAAGRSTQRRKSQLNKAGFFDIKFYHSKLW